MAPLLLHIDEYSALPGGVREALREDGYELAHTSDPEAAMRIAEERRPALVVMEIELEGCEGLDLMAGIRDLHGGSVPVLAVTRVPRDSGEHGEAIALGVSDFLTKPVRAAALLAAIREVVPPPSATDFPSSAAPEPSHAEADLTGDLSDTPMPELLARLRRRGANGVLAVGRGGIRVGVQLRNGSPVGVSSSRRDPHRVAEELLYETFRWESGRYAFSEGRWLEPDTMDELAGDPAGLLLAGVLDASPARLVRERLGKRESLYVSIIEQSEAALEAEGVGFTRRQRRQLESLGGADTLSVLLESNEFDERLVYALWVGGWLELRTAPTLTLTELLGDSGEVEPPLESREPRLEEPEPPLESREPRLEEPEPPLESREPRLEEPEPPLESREPRLEEPEPPLESREPRLEEPEPQVEAVAPRRAAVEPSAAAKRAAERAAAKRAAEEAAAKRAAEEAAAKRAAEEAAAKRAAEEAAAKRAERKAAARRAAKKAAVKRAAEEAAAKRAEAAAAAAKRAEEEAAAKRAEEEAAAKRAEEEAAAKRAEEEAAAKRAEEEAAAKRAEEEAAAKRAEEEAAAKRAEEEAAAKRAEEEAAAKRAEAAAAAKRAEAAAAAKRAEEEAAAKRAEEEAAAAKRAEEEAAAKRAEEEAAAKRAEEEAAAKRAEEEAAARRAAEGTAAAAAQATAEPSEAPPVHGEIAPFRPALANDREALSGSLRALAERVLAGDDFEALGITPSASDQAVREAYEAILREIPDIDPTAANLLLEQRAKRIRSRIEAAYANLRDEEKRRAYSLMREEEEQDRKAKPSAERALEGERWFRKGKAHLERRRCSEAVEAFGMASHLDPEQGEYASHLGYALFLSDPNSEVVQREAMEHVASGIKRSPKHELSYVYLGRILKAKGDVDVAKKIFLKALRIKPDFHPAVQELRLLEMRERKGKGVLKRLLGS